MDLQVFSQLGSVIIMGWRGTANIVTAHGISSQLQDRSLNLEASGCAGGQPAGRRRDHGEARHREERHGARHPRAAAAHRGRLQVLVQRRSGGPARVGGAPERWSRYGRMSGLGNRLKVHVAANRVRLELLVQRRAGGPAQVGGASHFATQCSQESPVPDSSSIWKWVLPPVEVLSLSWYNASGRTRTTGRCAAGSCHADAMNRSAPLYVDA